MGDERFEDLLERLGTNTRLDTVCLGPLKQDVSEAGFPSFL
jgi:hypothetical protein